MARVRREDLERPLEQSARRFNLLSDPTRLRILLLLDQAGEMNLTELRGAVGLSQPATSHHLMLLRRGRLIEDRRSGHFVYYRLACPAVRDLLRSACQLVEQGEGKE
jgi:DNA-binding transcriptional ArsR family regulator